MVRNKCFRGWVTMPRNRWYTLLRNRWGSIVRNSHLYRDYANYKNYNSVIFNNDTNLDFGFIEVSIRSSLIDGEWFYASIWGLPDLHFENFDDQNDHPYHEYEGIETTEESGSMNISGLLNRIQKCQNY